MLSLGLGLRPAALSLSLVAAALEMSWLRQLFEVSIQKTNTKHGLRPPCAAFRFAKPHAFPHQNRTSQHALLACAAQGSVGALIGWAATQPEPQSSQQGLGMALLQ